jgi:LmeA-like phospholipid-binding
MEFITILLSSILGLLSPAGVVLDQIAADAIRDRLADVEQLDVRIDNTPSYQLLQGKVDRVRIAGRGIFPIDGVRIDTIEIETDAIAVDPQQLRQGAVALEAPLRAGIRLVITRDDLVNNLSAEQTQALIEMLGFSIPGFSDGDTNETVAFIDPQITLLENDRIRFTVILQEQRTNRQNHIELETGVTVVAGRQIQLVDPLIALDGVPIPAPILVPLVAGLTQQLDLQRLQASGVTARLLDLDITPEHVAIAAFVQVDSLEE